MREIHARKGEKSICRTSHPPTPSSMEKKVHGHMGGVGESRLERSRRGASCASLLRDPTVESPISRTAERLSGERRGGDCAPPGSVPFLSNGFLHVGEHFGEKELLVRCELPGEDVGSDIGDARDVGEEVRSEGGAPHHESKLSCDGAGSPGASCFPDPGARFQIPQRLQGLSSKAH